MVHENIVKYYHCFEDDDFVYLVLELCESKVRPSLVVLPSFLKTWIWTLFSNRDFARVLYST